MIETVIAGLTLGVLGSVHCAGMCGPLLLSCTRAASGNDSQFVYQATYQVGRVLSYILLGAIFSTLGASINLLSGQQWISLLAGISIIILGIYGRTIEKYIPVSSFLAKGFAYAGKSNRWGSSFLFGALNGFLPCGLVYVALAASLSTGDPLHGALFMLCFGIATSPSLMLSAWLGGRFTIVSKKILPLVTTIAGLVLIVRGLQMELPNGWVNYLAMNPSLTCH